VSLPRFVRISVAAKLLNQPERTLRDWCAQGKVPGATHDGYDTHWWVPLMWVLTLRRMEEDTLLEEDSEQQYRGVLTACPSHVPRYK
jgi:hypothetical protein